MKKRNKKIANLLKLGIFLFGFSMLLWNCQENEETIPRAKIENEFTVTTIGRKQLIKNNVVNNRVEKINNKKQQQKSTETNSNDFVVIKDFITYIENNDGTYHSYTFPIKRTTTENYNLENLIISLNKDGSYKAVLVTYYFFNEQERNEFKINKGRNYNGEISYKEVTSEGLVSSLLAKEDVMNCIYVIYESCSYGNHVGGMLDDGSTCPGYTTSFDRVCTSRGGTDDSDTNTPTNPEDSSNDNDTNGGSGETGVITFPTFTDCPDNKVYNETTQNCECPEGKIEDGNGNCMDDPCKEISTQLLNTNFKAKKDELEKLTSKKQETGYVQNKTGTFTKLNPINGGHSLDLRGINYSDINGFIHTHLNNFETGKIVNGKPEINEIYKIFSPADVIAFLKIAKASTDISKVYATVITSSGDYTLKFTGDVNDIKGLKKPNYYRADYINMMKKGKEKGFLHFLKNHIKIDGIELYKLHKPLFSNTIKVQKKSLTTNGKVDKTECQ